METLNGNADSGDNPAISTACLGLLGQQNQRWLQKKLHLMQFWHGGA